MPARRRRSLIRSAVQRTEMWDAKMKGDIYKVQLEAVKDRALRRVAAYQSMHEQLIATVKRIVAESPEPFLVQEYMWFAEKMLKLLITYNDDALQKEADALYLWYLARGRSDITLRMVAQSLGIKISPLEHIAERVLTPLLISIVGKGTIIADGSEQTLIEYAGRVASISGYVDLSNMDAGDAVTIRCYVKIREDADYKLYRSETFEGKQPEPALYMLPRLSGFAFKTTLQQTSGAYKSYDYLFVKGV
jgi:hypothetical protein